VGNPFSPPQNDYHYRRILSLVFLGIIYSLEVPYITLVPLFAVILGRIILHEPITIIMMIGGLSVLAGIVLCNK
ncbi:MAG: hypothetical protein V7L05_10650, partial [Nostoc sp.]|uniref:hypothetical protein n=1 Tax=Nostoc sp. TaxID=1180 RepID=UPI002FFB4F6D